MIDGDDQEGQTEQSKTAMSNLNTEKGKAEEMNCVEETDGRGRQSQRELLQSQAEVYRHSSRT